MKVTLIGSRQTPASILMLMKDFVEYGNGKGYLFRSGGADGADSIVTQCARKKEIFLPWKNFNGVSGIVPYFTEEHEGIIKELHSAPEKLNSASMALHMRNINQVLGPYIKAPVLSNLVICWTPNGAEIGGTSTAIKLAKLYNIPVLNLFHDSDRKALVEIMERDRGRVDNGILYKRRK